MELAAVKFSPSFKYNLHDGEITKIHEIGSLEDLSSFTVAICIYRQFKYLQKTSEGQFQSEREVVDYFKDKFIKSVFELSLSSLLRKKILRLRGPIGFQLALWNDNHMELLSKCLINFSPEELIWMSNGTVDEKKTAEIFLRNEHLDMSNSFLLACLYFIKSWVFKLWPYVKSNKFNYYKNYFYGYWVKVCEGANVTRFEHEFLYALYSGNLAAIDYFLHQLKLYEKNGFVKELGKCALLGKKVDGKDFKNTCSIFSKGTFFDIFPEVFTNGEKFDFLKIFPTPPLLLFTYWPHNGQFMEVASHLYPNLKQGGFYFMIKILIHDDDLFFSKNFENFWLNSPKRFRQNFDLYIEDNIYHIRVLKLIEIMKEEERGKLFMKSILRSCNQHGITNGDFDMFKILLLIFTSSEEDFIALKSIDLAVEGYSSTRKENDCVKKIVNEKFNAKFSDLCKEYYDIIEKL